MDLSTLIATAHRNEDGYGSGPLIAAAGLIIMVAGGIALTLPSAVHLQESTTSLNVVVEAERSAFMDSGFYLPAEELAAGGYLPESTARPFAIAIGEECFVATSRADDNTIIYATSRLSEPQPVTAETDTGWCTALPKV